MTITTRAAKGGPLTHAEMDENFTDLRDGVNLMVPKDQGAGIRVDSLGVPTFAWHDLIGTVFVPDLTDPAAPAYSTYSGVIRQYEFQVNDEAQLLFHMPHDYVPGTTIYIHAHWSHTASDVTGGSVTWGFDLSHAKGHDQEAFSTPITIVEIQNASTTQRQHMVCEAPASISGGGPNLLDTDMIEPDCLIIGRIRLVANNITSTGPQPNVFLHTVDIHYQSSGVGTKNRAPNFWGV